MTGESGLLAADDQASTIRGGDPVLVLDDLSGEGFFDVSLTVRPGEVVGITGSGSSGRIALAETVVGLRKAKTGTISVDGKTPKPGDVASALAAGVGFVPRDRHHEGLVAGMTIADNVTMTIPARLGRFGFISPKKRDAVGARIDRATCPSSPAGRSRSRAACPAETSRRS